MTPHVVLCLQFEVMRTPQSMLALRSAYEKKAQNCHLAALDRTTKRRYQKLEPWYCINVRHTPTLNRYQKLMCGTSAKIKS